MATGTKICKVCGKEYACCKTLRRIEGIFRWQDVACSVEHGQIYLDSVLKARGEKVNAVESSASTAPLSEELEEPRENRRSAKRKGNS